jgi:uncharacterized protein (DUF2147 family)
MKTVVSALSFLILLGIAASAPGALNSPAGLWKTIDDKTGKERSLVRISERNGAFEGRVEKIFDQPDDDPSHLCKLCEGERKDKSVIGMNILWGLKKDGDRYVGGDILDPKNGKIYRAKIKLLDGGRKLEVRGFIGVSLFGRSQTWVREE